MNDTTTSGTRGGLNFWQWLGLLILVIFGVLYLWGQFGSTEPDSQPVPAQTTPDAGADQTPPDTPAGPSTAE